MLSFFNKTIPQTITITAANDQAAIITFDLFSVRRAHHSSRNITTDSAEDKFA